MPITVRAATAEDAAELARMNLIFNGVTDSPAQLRERLADPRRVETPLLAEVEGRAIGFAAVRVAPGLFYAAPRAELTELFVEEAYRRQGVGGALVACAERVARESGAEELWALTSPANKLARALYQARGYVVDDLAFRKTM